MLIANSLLFLLNQLMTKNIPLNTNLKMYSLIYVSFVLLQGFQCQGSYTFWNWLKHSYATCGYPFITNIQLMSRASFSSFIVGLPKTLYIRNCFSSFCMLFHVWKGCFRRGQGLGQRPKLLSSHWLIYFIRSSLYMVLAYIMHTLFTVITVSQLSLLRCDLCGISVKIIHKWIIYS